MDRAWHPVACSGLERPRLGQQPYDRGRRGCFHCGRDGHIQRNCPDWDNRCFDSGRFIERPPSGANGRWGNDSWTPSRISSSGGKEHGSSRTDSFRESSSRRPQFDYYENGDFSSQRPRENGDRYRNDEVRGYGAVPASNANVRDRDNVKERDYVRERDSSKTSARTSSRRAADDSYRATGSHRAEERKDSKSRDGESRSGKPVANGDAGAQSPSHPLVVGGDHARVKKDAKEDRPISKLSASDGDLVPDANIASVESALRNGNSAHQNIAASGKELEGAAPEKESIQLNGVGGGRDVECMVEQTTRSRPSSKRLSIAKLPLSVLCEDAAEGNLDKNYQREKVPASSPLPMKSHAPSEPIVASAGQGNDGEEGIVTGPILASAGQGHDGEEVSVTEPVSSSGQTKGVDGGIVTEPISSSGQFKGVDHGIVTEPISSSGQTKGVDGGTVTEPLSSSGQFKGADHGIMTEPISSSGQTKGVDDGIVTEPVMSLSGQIKDGEEEGAVVEPPVPSSLGESKDGEGVLEPVLSASGQSKDGEEALAVEPVLSSSGLVKHGQEGIVAEGQGDVKLTVPFPCVEEACSSNVKICEESTSSDHGRKPGGEGTKEKGNGEERPACQLAQQPDARIVSSRDRTTEGKPKRVSGWGPIVENAETRDPDKDVLHLSRREGKTPVANGIEGSEQVRPSGPPEHNAWTHTREVDDGRRALAPMKDARDSDRVRHSYHSDDKLSGRRPFSDRDYDEPEWRRRRSEPDYYRRAGNNSEQIGGMGIEGVSAKGSFRDHAEDLNYSCAETPVRGRHRNGDRDYSVDRHPGWGGSREGSLDRASDRSGYRHQRAGVKVEYWLHGGYGSSSDNRADTSDFQHVDDGGEHHRWVGSEWRPSRVNWEAHPGHSLYRPGSYQAICNARFHQLRRRSPPPTISPRSCHTAVALEPVVSPPRYVEEGYNPTSQSQGKGWVQYESQEAVQGPLLGYAPEKGLEDCPQPKADGVVCREGSHDRVLFGHASSPHDSNIASGPLETQAQSVTRPSPRPSEPATPSGRVLSPLKQTCKLEHADKDICPPGTEAHGVVSVGEDYEDFHIDERVERLMDGRTLIPGQEKDIVHEALSIASQRVQQEYELDIPIEESPRSHGGFADIGDQWKDGDFGNDVQGLEGFGCDQQVTKVDTKAEDAGVGVRSEGRAEVASAPAEAAPRPSGTVVPERKKHHGAGYQESLKWPSRGGDWKVVYTHDSSQHSKGETAQGTAEKGYSGYPRKMVMNGGVSLCGSKSNRNLRDPRRQHQESVRASVAEPMKLPLPLFSLLTKLEYVAEDHNVNHIQHPMTMMKGAMTPRSQGSTPRAHLATPVKDRHVSVGLAAGFKVNKSGKGIVTSGAVTGVAIKSLVQAKQQQQPLNRGSKVSSLSVRREPSNNVKNSSVIDKRGTPGAVAGTFDGHLHCSSDHHGMDTFDRKSKPSLPDGALETPSRMPQVQQASDLELSKSDSATPLKKLFLSRSLAKEGLDLERHDAVTKVDKNVFTVAAKEALGKCAQAKELSIVTTLAVPVSPALTVLTPAALNGVPITMSHLSVTDNVHSKVVTVEHTPNHEKRLRDIHSTHHASGSVNEAPCDNDAKMMDVEVEVCDRFTSLAQDVNFVDGRTFRSKRKASSADDVESFKQRQRSVQKRRVVRSEDGAVDRRPSHSSPRLYNVHTSFPLIEGSRRRSEADSLEGQSEENRGQELNWANLKPSILHTVFRFLRGDLKPLVNAMATCKSWFAAGQTYKTMLRRADLSSVHEQFLDAVLESLPVSWRHDPSLQIDCYLK